MMPVIHANGAAKSIQCEHKAEKKRILNSIMNQFVLLLINDNMFYGKSTQIMSVSVALCAYVLPAFWWLHTRTACERQRAKRIKKMPPSPPPSPPRHKTIINSIYDR